MQQDKIFLKKIMKLIWPYLELLILFTLKMLWRVRNGGKP